MDSAFRRPIHIHYRPPAWIPVLTGFSHAGAIVGVLTLPVPAVARCFVIAVLVFGLQWHLRQYWRQQDPDYCKQLYIDAADRWWLIDAQGARQASQLPCSLVHPAIIIVRTRVQGQTHTMIFTPATVNGDVLRRLRVRLRFPQRT